MGERRGRLARGVGWKLNKLYWRKLRRPWTRGSTQTAVRRLHDLGVENGERGLHRLVRVSENRGKRWGSVDTVQRVGRSSRDVKAINTDEDGARLYAC